MLHALFSLQGLQMAHDRMLGASFEAVLREAEAAPSRGAKPSGGSPLANGAPHIPEAVLLRRPGIFNLAIVWTSLQVGVAHHYPSP